MSTPARWTRHLVAPVVVAAFATTLLPATASAQTAPPTGTAAIVTALLNLFDFGDTVGLPLACELTSSVISEAGSQVSGFANQLGTECGVLSTKGDGYLQEAITKSQALTLVNPLLDPFIGALASGLQTVGDNYGSSLAPFGPTIAGLGGTVAFFEGS